MNRLNIFLLIVVMGCALSVVNATNQQRQIFIQLQRAQMNARFLAVAHLSGERGRLQTGLPCAC